MAAVTATIDNGASLSDAVHVRDQTLVAVAMPASWTAASLTFQASHDGTTYRDVYDAEGTEFEVAAAASRWIALDPADFASAAYLKVRSGTTGTPVNQGAERAVTLVFRLVR